MIAGRSGLSRPTFGSGWLTLLFLSSALPSGLGIALARALGGSPRQALYAGRIGMLAGYLAMGAGAALAMRPSSFFS